VARLLERTSVSFPLPGADLVVAPTLERHLEPRVLVPDSEIASGKPPPDETADPGRTTPTVRVATAHRVVRVMDALSQTSRHVETILRLGEPVTQATDVLLEKHGPEFGECSRLRPVFQGAQDRDALVDLEGEDAGATAVRGLEPVCEVGSSMRRASSRTSLGGTGRPAKYMAGVGRSSPRGL